ISGVSSGTANVCIFNSGVASSTVLQYYFGGFWVSATGVVVTPGVSICGNIPVSALNGTPIVPGNPPGGPTSVPEFPLTNALVATLAACTLLYLLMVRRARS
ncbi:MAG TPA: hypothetical protein VKF15_03080, partial [Nitrososphaerales archaeon]|nr:hypothetical protein [Nitrososphaerales archaeon]